MKRIKERAATMLLLLLMLYIGYCMEEETNIGNKEAENYKYKISNMLALEDRADSTYNAEDYELEAFMEKYIYGKWRFSRRVGVKGNDARSEWSNHHNEVDFSVQGAEEMTKMILCYSKNEVAVISGLDGTTFTDPIGMYLFGSSAGGLNSARYSRYTIMGICDSNSIYEFKKGDDPFAEGSLVWVTYTAGNDRNAETRLIGNCVGDTIYVNPEDTDTLYLDFCGFWELKREEKKPEEMDRGCVPDLTEAEKKFLSEHVYGTWVFSRRLYALEGDNSNITRQGEMEIIENVDITYKENHEGHYCGQDTLSNPEDVYLYFVYGGGNSADCVWHVWGEADTENIRLRNVQAKEDNYICFKEKEKLVEVSYDLGYNAYENPSVQIYGFGSHLYIDPEDTETLYLDFCGLWELKRKDIKVNSEYSIQQIENQLEITNCTYENKYEGNLIRIYYPQIENFEDDRKERRINALIKEETLKFLNGLENYDKGTYFFWDYEVKWLNRNMLNVYYEGSYGEAEAMEMCPFAGTIAIDFEEEKAITLSNIITDKNMLGSMLFNGRFENITVWDEIPEMNITGSDVFRQETVFDWRENNAGWYVEGNNLVIVCNTPYFNKYLMNIQEIEDILDSSFLDKLNAGHENVEQDELLTAIKYEYHNRQQSNRIDIYYPQIRGFADADREERINELIREDSLKLLNGVSYENGELYCQLDYEIKYMDEDIISIFYKGFDGSAKGRKLYSAAIATTVSLKEEEIINLNDIVTDFDVLADMLLEDKFENITIWEGMPGTIKMSWLYGKRRESLLENLQREEYDKAKDNIGWYTDGSIFVIVHDSIPDYDEYAINMQEIKSILCGTITSLYGKSGQDGSSPYVSGTFDK